MKHYEVHRETTLIEQSERPMLQISTLERTLFANSLMFVVLIKKEAVSTKMDLLTSEGIALDRRHTKFEQRGTKKKTNCLKERNPLLALVNYCL